ncbi:MAG: SH3 domain-containing protein [Chloroflexi bacterium]|nr:SH3 domain-containing protein [Chloroflexota bacterium]
MNRTRGALWIGLLIVLAALPGLACGSFAPRPTPTPTSTPTPTITPTFTATPIPPPPTPTFTPTPLPPTPTPTPPPRLQPNSMGWVIPGRVINVRAAPSARAKRVGQIAGGAILNVWEGPVEKDGYRWWKVDDRYGLVGWIAEGNGKDRWLVPLPKATPTPTGSRITVGSTVVVNTRGANWLALREAPGKHARILGRYPPGTRLTVLDGPVVREGFIWWRVQDKKGVAGWMAQGDREDRWLFPER